MRAKNSYFRGELGFMEELVLRGVGEPAVTLGDVSCVLSLCTPLSALLFMIFAVVLSPKSESPRLNILSHVFLLISS